MPELLETSIEAGAVEDVHEALLSNVIDDKNPARRMLPKSNLFFSSSESLQVQD